MPSIVRILFTITPVAAALLVLLAMPFAAQQVLAKPMSVSRTLSPFDQRLASRDAGTKGHDKIDYSYNSTFPGGSPALVGPSKSQRAGAHASKRRPSKGTSPKRNVPKRKLQNEYPPTVQPSSGKTTHDAPREQSQPSPLSSIPGNEAPRDAQQRSPSPPSGQQSQQIKTIERQRRAITQNRAQFHQLASQARVQGNNSDYQQQASTSLTQFQDNMLAAKTTLSELAADKGLANFDNKVELEVILKDLVNDVKLVLDDVAILIQNIPAIGPILGPVAWQIKCIIIDAVDLAENLIDGLLNDLEPLISDLPRSPA